MHFKLIPDEDMSLVPSTSGMSALQETASFSSRKSGLYLNIRNDENEIISEIRLGAFLYVAGKAKAADGTGHAIIAVFQDEDENMKQLLILRAHLVGTRRIQVIEQLVDAGYQMDVEDSPNPQLHITQFLLEVMPERQYTYTPSSGWYDGRYLFADETATGTDGKKYFVYPKPATERFQQAGSLEEWQNSIGRLSRGNKALMTGICTMLSSALLRITGVSMVIMHFYSETSTGKTTLLNACASVCGRGTATDGYSLPWFATLTGLEATAAEHNDATLVLDDLSNASPKIVDDAVYMLANGRGKSRGRPDGKRQRGQKWAINVLSSGEQAFSDKLSEGGLSMKGGQAARWANIPMERFPGGAFPELHGHPAASGLVDSLREAAKENYGQVFRAFVKRLEEFLPEKRHILLRNMRRYEKQMCSDNAKGDLQRIARWFAMTAAAGELAIYLGILPWENGEARDAVTACFQVYLGSRDNDAPDEFWQVVHRAQHFLSTHGASRFQNAAGPAVRCSRRVGFSRDEGKEIIYYVFPIAFKFEMFNGMDAVRAARHLKAAGMLIKGDGDNLQKYARFPGLERSRYYVLRYLDDGAIKFPDTSA